MQKIDYINARIVYYKALDNNPQLPSSFHPDTWVVHNAPTKFASMSEADYFIHDREIFITPSLAKQYADAMNKG